MTPAPITPHASEVAATLFIAILATLFVAYVFVAATVHAIVRRVRRVRRAAQTRR